MTADLLSVLSPQQKEICLGIKKGMEVNEIAKRLNVNSATIRTQLKRIRKKMIELDDADIDVVFNEETERNLPKLTVKQAQFLSQSKNMICKTKTQQTMSRRMGIKQINVRQMSPEELEQVQRTRIPPRTDPFYEVQANPRLAGYEMEYRIKTEQGYENLEYMASLEVILRAYGLIYRTPYINKLNRKTSIALKAKEEGYLPTLVKPGERRLLPQGSKFLESQKSELESERYSIWLVPKR